MMSEQLQPSQEEVGQQSSSNNLLSLMNQLQESRRMPGPTEYTQQAIITYLLQVLNSPKTPQQQQHVDNILKANPQIMVAFTKQPQQQAQQRIIPQVSKASNHLWEFIRDLLHDNEYNPRIIKWEDPDQGVFRIVDSKEVSALWGKKMNNPNMTYKKLSSSIRFQRTAKYFGEVPRDGRFPRKMVFKFGERATGWKPEKSSVSHK